MGALSDAIIAWQKEYGRHDLPWQNTRDPYAIWVSEIMLQQTQVSTVIAYYTAFMQRFPSLAALAKASQEEVLQRWSGLGYYSRARHLHKAAQIISHDFDGIFPHRFEDMMHLPGIGRSTAAAISTFAFNHPQPILDGNVKRLFARYFMLEEWTGKPTVIKHLWHIAERENPDKEAIAYTQGLMDLGATICTRSKPKCVHCPLKPHCLAYAENKTQILPVPRPKKMTPQKQTTMLIIKMSNEILLEKRPQRGIWAGLWSLPEISAANSASQFVKEKFGLTAEAQAPQAIIKHAFTHYRLAITPQPLQVSKVCEKPLIADHQWLSVEAAIGAALPAPVRSILRTLLDQPST